MRSWTPIVRPEAQEVTVGHKNMMQGAGFARSGNAMRDEFERLPAPGSPRGHPAAAPERVSCQRGQSHWARGCRPARGLEHVAGTSAC